MARAAAAIICMLAGAAQAECPVAADLDEGGIRFLVEGGETEVFTRRSEDIVQSVYRTGDDYTSRVLLAQGLYMVEYVELNGTAPIPSTRATYAFPLAPEEMPAPVPAGSWSTEIAFVKNGGFGTELHQYRYGPMSETVLGACSYRMIPVIAEYSRDGDLTHDELNWLPDLGVSYLVRSVWGEGDDRYVYYGIETVKED